MGSTLLMEPQKHFCMITISGGLECSQLITQSTVGEISEHSKNTEWGCQALSSLWTNLLIGNASIQAIKL